MPEAPTRIHLYHKLPSSYNDLLFRALHAHDGLELQVSSATQAERAAGPVGEGGPPEAACRPAKGA